MYLRAYSSERRRTSAGARPRDSFTTLNSIGSPWQSQPGTIRRTVPQHRVGFDDDILEHLVQRRAHVHVAIGERWPIVEHEELRFLSRLQDLPVKPRGLPLRQPFRFALDQVSLHRKARLR